MRIFVRLLPSGRCLIKYAIPVHASKRCVKHTTGFIVEIYVFFNNQSMHFIPKYACKNQVVIIILKQICQYRSFQHLAMFQQFCRNIAIAVLQVSDVWKYIAISWF